MKPSLRGKLDQIAERFEEITALMADPDIQSNQNQFRDLGREYAQLEPVVVTFREYVSAEEDIDAAQEMIADPEMADLAKE
ncbi:MAG: PCRF domain-containing protein, partial [Candidatus Thiodiazotropha sp. 6PDIVS]